MPIPFITVINSLLPEPHASLLNGILFGTRGQMPDFLYQDLLTTGTLHIIALSGMNISILVSLISRVTFFMGRKTSSILTICLIVLFVLFVGPSPSIIRAAMMGSLGLIAVYFGRRDWGLLSLFLTAGIMLVINFSLINNLSFQLSFLATLGILLANRRLKRQRKNNLMDQLINIIKENFWITLSAQVFTLPIILYRFGRISLISPLANLLIEWVIQPVMVLGVFVSIIGWLYLPLAVIPSWVLWILLSYFIQIITILAKIPGASINL